MRQTLDELRKLHQRLERQARRTRLAHRSRIPIRPFTPHGKAPAVRFAQDQRLGPADAAGLEYGEALSSKGVEGVADLSPSQRLVGELGSSC